MFNSLKQKFLEIIGFIKYWLRVVVTAVNIWLHKQAFAHAAALAFFTLFSIAPMIIVLVSLIGLFYGQEAAQGQIVLQLQESIGDEAAEAVQSAVVNSRIDEGGLLASLSGLLAMLIGATTVFAQMQASLNSIWDVVPRPSRNSILVFLHKRVTSLMIVVAVGFVMLVSLSLSVTLQAVLQQVQGWLPLYGIVFSILEILLSLLIATILFGAIFYFLPDVVLERQDVILGAAVTSVLFILGRTLIAYYLSHTAPASTFGAAGSLVLLLLWVYYSSLILLFGAAFTKAQLIARGATVRPRRVAVRVHHETILD